MFHVERYLGGWGVGLFLVGVAIVCFFCVKDKQGGRS
jgi:hypothetical protein